jgi:DNA-binding protein HU-beta
MNKADLVAAVAASADVSKAKAEEVINAFLDQVVSSAKSGDKVTWPGFGSFSISERAARTGRNPQTGEAVQVKASRALKFSASSKLKSDLNPNR